MPSYSAILATDADENITVSSSATSLTLPSLFAAGDRQTKGVTGGKCTIQVRTAPIIFTLNGTAPTAADESTGTKLHAGDFLVLTTLIEMDNLKMIRATSTDAAVFVFYERRVN